MENKYQQTREWMNKVESRTPIPYAYDKDQVANRNLMCYESTSGNGLMISAHTKTI